MAKIVPALLDVAIISEFGDKAYSHGENFRKGNV
jgi:hypothetical protein